MSEQLDNSSHSSTTSNTNGEGQGINNMDNVHQKTTLGSMANNDQNKRVKFESSTVCLLHDPLPTFDLDELYSPVQITVETKRANGESFTFTISRELICAHSEYFRAAFKGGFEEANKRHIKLDDVDMEVFACFVNFLHTLNIIVSPKLAAPGADPNDGSTFKWQFLARLYIFGDKYMAQRFRCMVFEKFQLKALKRYPSPSAPIEPQTIELIYAHLPAVSPLRRFLVDSQVACSSSLPVADQAQAYLRYPQEFLAECFALSQKRMAALQCEACNREQQGLCYDDTHSPDDIDVGREKRWGYFHEHEGVEEERACMMRYKSFEWQLFCDEGSVDD